jgi:hypothetical protein
VTTILDGSQSLKNEIHEFIATAVANGSSLTEISQNKAFINLIPDKIKISWFKTGSINKDIIKYINDILRTPATYQRFKYLRIMFNTDLEENGMLSYTQRRRMLAEIATDYEMDVDTRMKAIALDATLAGDIKSMPQTNVVVKVIDKIKNR